MTRARTRTAALTIALVLLVAGVASATPPDRIRLSYSDSIGILTIAVHHPTFYPAAHHVAKVAVMLNDSVFLVRQFARQTNSQELDMECPVPGAKPGDRLTVTAICSIYGKRTEMLVLRPGPNGVSRLAPGVYFVRDGSQASSLKPQAVRKIVI